jgi:hypothetical protein
MLNVQPAPLPIREAFRQLGAPEHVGHAFAFTEETFNVDFGKAIENIPKPDFEHRVYRDTMTGNFLVVRPDKAGTYGSIARDDWMKQVR